jgi:hypothetical protein
VQEADDVLKNQVYDRNTQAFFGNSGKTWPKQPPTQSEIDAAAVFYGVDSQTEAEKLGEPIPGYSGVNRRVQADNVFGMTYAEARRRAMES